VWWYKFRFAGQVIRESSKSESKTVAKDAEGSRRRELEESFNRISTPRTAQLFSVAAEAWLITKTAHLSPRSLIVKRANLKHINPHFRKMLQEAMHCRCPDLDPTRAAKIPNPAALPVRAALPEGFWLQTHHMKQQLHALIHVSTPRLPEPRRSERAGCSQEALLAALGIEAGDLSLDGQERRILLSRT
jgi:hypothetical protein